MLLCRRRSPPPPLPPPPLLLSNAAACLHPHAGTPNLPLLPGSLSARLERQANEPAPADQLTSRHGGWEAAAGPAAAAAWQPAPGPATALPAAAAPAAAPARQAAPPAACRQRRGRPPPRPLWPWQQRFRPGPGHGCGTAGNCAGRGHTAADGRYPAGCCFRQSRACGEWLAFGNAGLRQGWLACGALLSGCTRVRRGDPAPALPPPRHHHRCLQAARAAALQQLHQRLFDPAAQRQALQLLPTLWPRLLELLLDDPSPAITAAAAPAVGAVGALASQASAAAAAAREAAATGAQPAAAPRSGSAGGLLFDWLLPVLQRRATPAGRQLAPHQLSAVLLALRDCLAGAGAGTSSIPPTRSIVPAAAAPDGSQLQLTLHCQLAAKRHGCRPCLQAWMQSRWPDTLTRCWGRCRRCWRMRPRRPWCCRRCWARCSRRRATSTRSSALFIGRNNKWSAGCSSARPPLPCHASPLREQALCKTR